MSMIIVGFSRHPMRRMDLKEIPVMIVREEQRDKDDGTDREDGLGADRDVNPMCRADALLTP